VTAEGRTSLRRLKTSLKLLALGGLGLLCALYALGYLSETLLRRQLQGALADRELSVSWRRSDWGLGRACVEELSWSRPNSSAHGSARRLCVSARWRWAWPPVSPSHLLIKAPKVVLPLEQLKGLIEPKPGGRRSGARASQRSSSMRASQLLGRLRARLPFDMDLQGASIWLTREQESVASLGLSLSWSPSASSHEPLARFYGQARARGAEAPFDFIGALDEERLELKAKGEPWRLSEGPQRLSLGGLQLELSSGALRAEGLGLELEGLLSAGLSAKLSLGLSSLEPTLRLGPGRITLQGDGLKPARVAEALKALSRQLKERLVALGLSSRARSAQGSAQGESAGILSQAQAWGLSAQGLQITQPSSYGGPVMELTQLGWSRAGLRLELKTTLQELMSLSDKARLPHQAQRLIDELATRLKADVKLSAEGSGRPGSTRAIESLTLDLSQAQLKLSDAEPPLTLPSLRLRLPQRQRGGDGWRDFELSLSSEGLEAQGEGALQRSVDEEGAPRYELRFELGGLSCQDAIKLIPPEALGPIKSLDLRGEVAPQIQLRYAGGAVDFKLKRLLRRCTFEGLELSSVAALEERVRGRVSRASLRDVLWLKSPFVFEIDPIYSEGERVLVGPGSQSFVPLSELPSYVAGAMYLTEEMGFWTGGAVSPALVEKAINTNLKSGRFVYGGSTITQQLVKNLFLSRDKRLTRKLQEALISARLIDAIGKERILELYLNCIEFGPGVFGVKAAASYYFQKDPRALTPQQAVFLAMLKVSPKRGARWKRRGSSPTFTWWKARSVEVFKRLVDKGHLSPRQASGKAPFVFTWDKEGRYLGSKQISD